MAETKRSCDDFVTKFLVPSSTDTPSCLFCRKFRSKGCSVTINPNDNGTKVYEERPRWRNDLRIYPESINPRR